MPIEVNARFNRKAAIKQCGSTIAIRILFLGLALTTNDLFISAGAFAAFAMNNHGLPDLPISTQTMADSAELPPESDRDFLYSAEYQSGGDEADSNLDDWAQWEPDAAILPG